MVQFYDGMPVGICDYISDAKTVGTQQRLLDDLRDAARRGRAGRPDGAGRPAGRDGRQPGDEGRDADARQVVRRMALFNTLKVAKLIGVRP